MPPALGSTDEISSHLLQNPLQTESADTHDQIIPLASHIHSSPCGHESRFKGFSGAGGGRRAIVHFLRRKTQASSLLCTFLTGQRGGRVPPPIQSDSLCEVPPALTAHIWITRRFKPWVLKRQLYCLIREILTATPFSFIWSFKIPRLRKRRLPKGWIP